MISSWALTFGGVAGPLCCGLVVGLSFIETVLMHPHNTEVPVEQKTGGCRTLRGFRRVRVFEFRSLLDIAALVSSSSRRQR